MIREMFGEDFDLVLGQREGVPRKPSPVGALKIAEEFGLDPRECMYVGDTYTDMPDRESGRDVYCGRTLGLSGSGGTVKGRCRLHCGTAQGSFDHLRGKTMIRFVASDLDGTLLQNGAQQLPKEIYPMIRRLKELGILFAAASGRQYANMKLLFAPVLSDMAFICENGAMAVQDDRILYQDAFDHGLVQEIVKAVYEKEGSRVFLFYQRFFIM